MRHELSFIDSVTNANLRDIVCHYVPRYSAQPAPLYRRVSSDIEPWLCLFFDRLIYGAGSADHGHAHGITIDIVQHMAEVVALFNLLRIRSQNTRYLCHGLI